MDQLSDEDQKTELGRANERLCEGINRLILIAVAIPDRRQGAKVLRATLDLMFACADTASRIDRKLLPRIARRRGAQKNAEVRTANAAEKWQNESVDIANELLEQHPTFSKARIASLTEEKFKERHGLDESPVKWKRLYEFLCKHKINERFEKVPPSAS